MKQPNVSRIEGDNESQDKQFIKERDGDAIDSELQKGKLLVKHLLKIF